MRFLQTAVEQNQRRLQIEDMILLALRCALLVLLALALARPALLGEARDLLGQSKVTAVIVLDHSRSMGVTDGTSTRFDKAKKSAEQIVDSLPSGSSVAVLVASDTVRGAIAEPTYDLNLARKVIRDSTLTDRASDLFPAWQKAVETLHGRLTLRREIYLITDAQAVAWRQLPEIQRLLEQNKSEIRSHIILINEHEEKNLAITDLRLASGLCAARQTMRFEVKVTNYGREEARNIPIRLSIDGEAPADEINVESLPPGVTKNVTLFAKFRMEGFHGVTAQIPEDRLTADDRRTIVVRALAEAKVLLVDGDPGKEARESEVFFLRHALTPVAPDQAADYFVKSVTIPAAELSQARFDDFDTVILANVTDLNDTVIQALVSYLQRGGGLMVFPGNRLDPNFYNVKLFRERQILPAEFGTVVGAADQEEQFVGLQAKGFEHGITELWNDPGSGRLDTARFFRHFELKWASPGASPSGAAAGQRNSSMPRSARAFRMP